MILLAMQLGKASLTTTVTTNELACSETMNRYQQHEGPITHANLEMITQRGNMVGGLDAWKKQNPVRQLTAS